jgi:hypothetical protein
MYYSCHGHPQSRGGIGMLPPVKSRVTVVSPRIWSNTLSNAQPRTRILIRERLLVQVLQNDAFEGHAIIAMFHLDSPSNKTPTTRTFR